MSKQFTACCQSMMKSPSDDRDYLGFQLSNKLKVVVISDSTTEKAAASMNVQIGTLLY